MLHLWFEYIKMEAGRLGEVDDGMVRGTWAQWLGFAWSRLRRHFAERWEAATWDRPRAMAPPASQPSASIRIRPRRQYATSPPPLPHAGSAGKAASAPPPPLPAPAGDDLRYRLPDPPAVRAGRGGGAGWLVPRVELTSVQLAMVSAPPDRNRLVVGFPGSGKTQVLVHRAEHLRRTARFGARPFRIFLFTNVLRDYIRSALDVLDLPPGSVCTFDAWCHDFHAVHCRGRAPGRGRPRRPSFDAVRREVLEFIERQGFPGEPLEFALVDEGQDLPLEAYAILRRIALHVTVFADPHQQVYDDRPSLDAIRAALGIPSGAVEMLGAYRNSPAVAALAARFIEDPAERKRYRAQGCAGQKVRERPLLFLAPSFGAEMDRLAEVVRRRRGLNQRVGILASNGGAVERIAEALEERGVEVEKALPPPPEVRATGATWIRFDSDAPKVVGLHSAKGLTFDCVCLPALTRDALGWLRAPSRRRLLFSAVARATQWVYLSAEEGRALGEVLDLLEGEREGLLSVQRAAAEIPSSPASTDREEISIL